MIEDEEAGADGPGLMDRRRLALEHLTAHLHAAHDWDRLFHLMDEGEHRVQQAAFFESFDRPSADLEQYALPAAIEWRDWERFTRYAAMAANLRGLAEELAEEEILQALARQGRSRLAAGLVGQLADPLRRTWARTVLASCSHEAVRADLGRTVRDELDDLQGPLTEGRLSLLQRIAHHLGPELDDLWHRRLPGWVPDPAQRDEIRWTLAEAWAARHGLLTSRCRETLREVAPQILIERLAGLWLRYGPDDVSAIRELTAELGDPDGRLFWNVAVTVLGRMAAAADDVTWAAGAWETQAASEPPVPWSPALVEQGRDLFGRLSASAADRLAAEMNDPLARVALRVVRLELRMEPHRARAAFMAVETLVEPEKKLHWALRTALAWPEQEAQERRRLASVLTHHLRRRRYTAEAADLARFLDLVDATYPEALRAHTDNIIWAPAMRPDALLTLAESVQRPAVLAGLIQRGESYASAVGKTEAESFELRTRLLILASRRLCRMRGAWDSDVVRKLLPEEEDELREAAARELAARGKTTDAVAITQDIRSPRRKLIVQLAIDPRTRLSGSSFEPEDLYGAVASVDAAADESLALEMLAEPPLAPEALVESYLTRMHGRERRVQALVDLARRAQALEELQREGQRDPLAPLQLIRGSLTAVGTDERLLGLTLELVELAAPLQRSRALAEVDEAIEMILLRLEVPWEMRRAAFETLLARTGPILLDRPMRDRELLARCRAVAELVNRIVDLPDRAEESAARDELRAHWHEVFPVVLATIARMNGLVMAHLEHPLRARIWGHWLPEISRLVGWERSWNGLARLADLLLPRTWRQRLRTRWNGLKFARFATSWRWLDEDQKEILQLCFGDPDELSGRITGSAGERGLIFRLAAAHPSRLPEALRRFAEPERSRLALSLIRDGWASPASPAVLSELLATLGDPALRLEAESRQKGESWLGALAERVAQHGLDTSDPAVWPLLRRLRDEAPPAVVLPLAESVLRSLPWGRGRGKEAFQVWLNGFLASRANESREASTRAGRVREALQKALRLGPTRRKGEIQGDGETAVLGDGEKRGRLPAIYLRWTTVQLPRQFNRMRDLLVTQSGFAATGGLVLGFATFFLFVIDGGLWISQASERPASPFRPSWHLATLALLLLANTRISAHLLGNRDPHALSRMWRIGTALTCSIPILGLYTFPAMARWGPSGSAAAGGEPLSLGTPRALIPRRILDSRLRFLGEYWMRVLFQQWSFAFYLLTNLFVVGEFIFWGVPGRSWALTVISFILRAAAASGLVISAWWVARKRNEFRVPPVLLLIPASLTLSTVPFVPLLGVLLYVFSLSKRADRTVVRTLDETRQSSLRLPRGLELRDTWNRVRSSGLKNRLFGYLAGEGPWWQISSVHERKKSERSLHWLYTIKSAALIFDGAALAWVIYRPSEGLLDLILLISLVTGGIGLLLMLISACRRWGRARDRSSFLDHHPAHRYLAGNSLIFATGLLLGHALRGQEEQQVAGIIAIVSLTAAAIRLPRLALSMFRSSRPDDPIGAFLLSAAFAALAFLMEDEQVWTEMLLWFFKVCIAIVPLAVPLLLLPRLAGSLLRPFGPEDILDPAWPRPLRCTLLFLAVTALLPFGGLAVPAWIWIRDRRWPGFEREWQERVPRRQGAGRRSHGGSLQAAADGSGGWLDGTRLA